MNQHHLNSDAIASEPGGRNEPFDQHEDLYDPEYCQWRSEQIRKFDEDYRSWRLERFRRFSEEFSQWRQERGTQQKPPQAATQGLPAGSLEDAVRLPQVTPSRS
jgi:hypothetical protein